MTHPVEMVLCYLPGSSATERLAVVRCGVGADQTFEIRQQSWGNGLGWFTQSCVAVQPEQVAALRNVLGANVSNGPRVSAPSHLRVVH